MSRNHHRHFTSSTATAIAVVVLTVLSFTLSAQRRATPVTNSTNTPIPINENRQAGDTLDRSRLVEMSDAAGNIIMVDTITGKEWVDTLGGPQVKIPKMQQPLLYSASVSADIFTPLMRAFGQHYGLFEVAAEVNLHNRYIPVVEFGLGKADYAPDDNNYVYNSPVAPFFRLGANYNFLYNSNPDYMVFAGLRYGFTPFRFSVTDVSVNNGYWGTNERFDIPSQNVFAGYLHVMLGIRVRIIDNLSLGWTVRYHTLLHESSCRYGEPWYIPGFGSRNSALGATFSVTYTFPFPHKQPIETTDIN